MFLAIMVQHGGMIDQMSPPELLTTGQAAALLGSSRQHVVDLCERGEIPYLTTGTHRRLRSCDVVAFAGHGSAGDRLTRDQLRSLWLHRAVAGRVALDPVSVLNLARANSERLLRIHPTGGTAQWLGQWQKIIDQGPEAVMDTLTSRSQLAVDLRQSSPFARVLTEAERQSVLRAFRRYWLQVVAG